MAADEMIARTKIDSWIRDQSRWPQHHTITCTILEYYKLGNDNDGND